MSVALAQAIGLPQMLVVVLYLLVIGYLGWLGYRRTKTAADYLIAGREIHPFVMAMSYGATFISTSAIVGFGGVAGLFGMSLLWLTFLNIFVGIFIAFVFLGGPTRRMGHRLDAHTFPELLGRRFQSKFLQVFSGLVIFLFIPLYAAAVLIGGCHYIAEQFSISYDVALLVFSVIIAAYVVVGGLKGVMYTDALQGTIMFIGMVILLIFTYSKLGGLTEAHESLGAISGMVPGGLKKIGHEGWSTMPAAGWDDIKYNLWWIVISTITLGVGIGVLAQPQLAVRFMTVKSKRELNRAVLVGGIFILVMTGVAFTVGSLSNAYFVKEGPLFKGRIVKDISAEKGQHALQLMTKDEKTGQWADVMDAKDPEKGKVLPVVLDAEKPRLDEKVVVGDKTYDLVQGRSIAIVYAKGNSAKIIPLFVKSAMPPWFSLLFLLTLLAAAMSTLSSQFHAVGTSIGRDVYEQITRKKEGAGGNRSIVVVRVGIIVGILIAVVISHIARGDAYIIPRATSIFFGLCGSAFLPAFVGGLFFKRMTRPAAISSMLVGFGVTAFWLLLVKSKEASSLGLVGWLTDGKTSILAGHPNWDVVDPIVIALPLSILTAIVVSMLTQPSSKEHLDKCFAAK